MGGPDFDLLPGIQLFPTFPVGFSSDFLSHNHVKNVMKQRECVMKRSKTSIQLNTVAVDLPGIDFL